MIIHISLQHRKLTFFTIQDTGMHPVILEVLPSLLLGPSGARRIISVSFGCKINEIRSEFVIGPKVSYIREQARIHKKLRPRDAPCEMLMN